MLCQEFLKLENVFPINSQLVWFGFCFNGTSIFFDILMTESRRTIVTLSKQQMESNHYTSGTPKSRLKDRFLQDNWSWAAMILFNI